MNCADNSGAKSESRCQRNMCRSASDFGRPLRYLRCWFRCPTLATPSRCCRRHGHGFRQEGKARAQEEGHARRHLPTAKALAKKGRCLPLLRGQRRCHCQRQGRDEGFRHQRTVSLGLYGDGPKVMLIFSVSLRSAPTFGPVSPRTPVPSSRLFHFTR
jgi:hypothetical protein